MNYYHVPAVFFITFVMVLLIALYTRRRLRTLWIIFLAIFLITWSGQLWVRPFGPTWHGISWIPLFTISFITSVLMLSMMPGLPTPKKKDDAVSMGEAPL